MRTIPIFLVLLGGCVNSGVPGSSGTGGLGEACRAADSCEGGLLCFDGVCRQVCADDNDCPKVEACDNGVCLTVEDGECASDADCNDPPRCQIIDGAECWGATCSYGFSAAGEDCNDGDTCTDFEECDGAGHCIGTNICCGRDSDCDHLDRINCVPESCQGGLDDYTCNDDGRCEESTVEDDSYCAGQTTLCGDFANIVCTAETVQPDQSCPTTCAPSGPDEDALCDPGLTCAAGTCTLPVGAGDCCHNSSCGNADCTGGFHCGDTQTPAVYVCCADAGGSPENLCCTEHDDCPDGNLCNAAFICTTGCTGRGDEQCKDGWHCNGSECIEDFDNQEDCGFDTDCESLHCTEDLDEPGVFVCATADHCVDDATEYETPDGVCIDTNTFETCTEDGTWSPPANCTGATPLCDDQTGIAVCLACTEDEHCDDDLWCTGAETCGGGTCVPGTAPCTTGPCREPNQDCAGCASGSDCLANLPIMTGYTTPSGEVTESSTWSSGTPGWHALDGDQGTSWLGALRDAEAGYDGTDWIAYDLGAALGYVSAYRVTAANYSNADRSPSSWLLEGWDDSAWHVVDTVTGETGWGGIETRAFVVDAPGSYGAYRMSVTEIQDVQGDIVAIAEIELLADFSAVPEMTADDSPSGFVETSTNYNETDYQGWRAFEPGIEPWISDILGSTYPGDQWISYEWGDGQARTVVRYQIHCSNYSLPRSPTAWKLEGWDGDAWQTVDERGQTTLEPDWDPIETRSYEVGSPGAYARYRLWVDHIENDDGDVVGISYLQFFTNAAACNTNAGTCEAI